MTSRAKRQRQKYSPIHMVTAPATTSPPQLSAADGHSYSTAADKENHPPNQPPAVAPHLAPFSHSQLYDDHSTPPSQKQQQPQSQSAWQQSSPLRHQPPARPLQLSSPPRKHASAFTPLGSFTPLSFRDVHERGSAASKPLPLFSTPQPSQPRPSTSSPFFRPITQPHSFTPLSLSFASSIPFTPLRPVQLSASHRLSQSAVKQRDLLPPPSSYSSEKARFLRSLPQAHKYDAFVSALEDEEQAAAEWSESLAAPCTPPLSPDRLHDSGNSSGEADVPATPPSVCSLTSSSASSVASFASPLSAALSAIGERSSVERGRRRLEEEDEILTPSPDVSPAGVAGAAGGVPGLPASIFSSVFSQRLPLPPLTAEAKQMMVNSPPLALTHTVPSNHPASAAPVTVPALKPVAFTFAQPLPPKDFTPTAGEWKGVMHIDEDRLYNATPTQSSASSSPLSWSAYISPSRFLSQASSTSAASATSATSAASTVVSTLDADSDSPIPQLEKDPTEQDSEAERQQSASLPSTDDTPVDHGSTLPPVVETTQRAKRRRAEVSPPGADVPSASQRRTSGRRTSLRNQTTGTVQPSQADAVSQVNETAVPEHVGTKQRGSRSRRSTYALSPTTAPETRHADKQQDETAAAPVICSTASPDEQPKRRRSARVASASLSQSEEDISATQPVVILAPVAAKQRSKRVSKSLPPPTAAPSPSSPSLSCTQPTVSLSQRAHRASRSALSAAWQCGWCTWQSPMLHMSCDMCAKARGTKPHDVLDTQLVNVTNGRAKRGRVSSSKGADSQTEATSQPRQSQPDERGSGGTSGQEMSDINTPVSQQLLDTPESSSPTSQPAEPAAIISQPTGSPPTTHSPALSPATLLAEINGEEEAGQVATAQALSTVIRASTPVLSLGSRLRRRERMLRSGGEFSATQATDDGSSMTQTDTLHRRRRRRHW